MLDFFSLDMWHLGPGNPRHAGSKLWCIFKLPLCAKSPAFKESYPHFTPTCFLLINHTAVMKLQKAKDEKCKCCWYTNLSSAQILLLVLHLDSKMSVLYLALMYYWNLHIPPSPSSTESKRLFYKSVSFFFCSAYSVIINIFLNSIYMC